LHPAMERLFLALGVDLQINQAKFLRHLGHSIESRGKRNLQAFGSGDSGPWKGYLVDRSKMHKILLEEAARCGARVLRGTRAIRPILRAGLVTGVITSNGQYESRFVLDASGHRSWLGRHLNLESVQVSPRLIARFGWLQPIAPRCEEEPLPRFWMGRAGWEWSAPIREDCYAWVRLNLFGAATGERAHRVPREKGYPIGTAGARDVTWRIVPRCAGPGYFLIGDAAWVLDPACSHGVLKATLSAMTAAEAIATAPHPPERAYCGWMRDWFCSDAAALIELYSQASSPAPWLQSAREGVRRMARIPSLQAFSISPRE